MDPRFLTKINQIEEGEGLFRSKKYVIVDKDGLDRNGNPVDPTSEVTLVTPQHPNNVILIDSPDGEALPTTKRGERRVTNFAEAIRMASVMSRLGSEGASIVLQAGYYVDPMASLGEFGLQKFEWKIGFSLEFIGTENVRIVNTIPDLFVFCGLNGEFSFKNISIYDFVRESTPAVSYRAPTFYTSAAKVSMADVRMHCGRAIYCCDGTKLFAIDCIFSQSADTIHMWDSNAEFRNTHFFYPALKESCCGITVNKGRAAFHHCQMIVKEKSTYKLNAIHVRRGGKLVVTDSLVSGFDIGVRVQDSFSEAAIDRCSILDCLVAVLCVMNSSALVADSELAAYCTLKLGWNEKGSVQFLRNSVKPYQFSSVNVGVGAQADTEAGAEGGLDTGVEAEAEAGAVACVVAARILTDRKPRVLEHDFKDPEISRFKEEWNDFSTGANKKSRSECNSQFCLYCNKPRNDSKEDPEVSFKYCSGCKKVCYCSKECKDVHWRDHKLVCSKS